MSSTYATVQAMDNSQPRNAPRTVGLSNKYYDYYAKSDPSQQATALRGLARDAQTPRKAHKHSASLTSSSFNSHRGSPIPSRSGYEESKAYCAPPTHDSQAPQRAQATHQSSNQGQVFDYYKTPASQKVPSVLAIPGTSNTRANFSQTMRGIGQENTTRASQPPVTGKRPGLECTVCGPGASGPWVRGPIGPFTLCRDCAKIEWKEEDASLSLTLHEALSLLDNMRLIRLASVTRHVTNRDQETLARRLQQGLPESTYNRAEEYFARQAKVPAHEVTDASRVNTAIKVSQHQPVRTATRPVSSGTALAGQKRPREYDEPPREAKRDVRDVYPNRGPTPRRASAEDKTDYLSAQRELDVLSPQGIAVAALLGQSRSAQTAPIRVPLTPSRVEASSAQNRETRNEYSARQEQQAPSASHGCSSIGRQPTSGSDKKYATSSGMSVIPNIAAAPAPPPLSPRKPVVKLYKPFPFRREGTADLQRPSSRIIDRRRERNESLRRRYMEKRLQQQQRAAQEAKIAAAKSECSDEELRNAAPAPTSAATVSTPSSTSTETPTAIRALSSTPASLMNLLNTHST